MNIGLIDLKNRDNVKLIKDILIYPLKVNRDETGILVETLRSDWPEIYGKDREFAMQYFSLTQPGVARDEKLWHYHPTVQEDRFLVAYGEIITAVADNRKESETFGLLNLFRMSVDKDPYILLIPKRTLHAFMVSSKTPAVLLNFPTSLYNSREEVRVTHEEAGVKFIGGSIFTWQKVREELRNLNDQD